MVDCANPELLTPEQLAALVKLLPEFRDWLNAVEAEAMKLATDGQLPGFKLVAGRSLRKWMDETKAEQDMLAAGFSDDDLYSRSFVSVAQAEKLLGKALFRKLESDLVYRTEGKPVLAPLSDRRPAIHAAAEFEPVNEEDIA